MKKLILLVMVMCITIPAMAVDISLVDNADGTGTIRYTAAAGEVVRGLAIVVDAGAGSITAVTAINAEFNVFPDSIYTTPANGVGDGTPVADPDAAGEISLPASKIVLSMGVVDTTGNQGGAADAGTYDVATIAICGPVTITVDTLRGGIVGDNVTIGTVLGGTTTCAAPCEGDADGDGDVDIDDLGIMVNLLGNNEVDVFPGSCAGIGLCQFLILPADSDWNAALDFDDDLDIDIDDLGSMVNLLGNNEVDVFPGSCAGIGLCQYLYTCP